MVILVNMMSQSTMTPPPYSKLNALSVWHEGSFNA
ncbi:MAG: hypothetical protein RL180_1404 [Pseudomonadota bacterium]|jgi:hypothetical protein